MDQQKEHVDFNAWVGILTRLTARAQATFLNLYIRQLGPSLCRSVIKYCHARLNTINSKEYTQSIWDSHTEIMIEDCERL